MSNPDFPPGFRARDRAGDYEVLRVDGDYRHIRYANGDEARRHISLLRLAWQNRQFDAPPPPPTGAAGRAKAAPRAAKKPGKRSSPTLDEPSFKRDETSPLVADLIGRLAGDPPTFVTHAQLAAALLDDPRGRRLVAHARELQGDDRTPEHIAANMVAWFSQEITARASPFTRRFERKKIRGQWAYRPRQ